MLSIVTLNLDKGLWQEDSDGVMTDAQTVYGSTKHLYVATQRWIDPRHARERPADRRTTLISRFDVTDPDRTTYEGQRRGPRLPAQPVLAVRAGRRPARGLDDRAGVVERARSRAERRAQVTVLRRDGATLRQVGQRRRAGPGRSGSTRCASSATSATS